MKEPTILSTRFNDHTWSQSLAYREQNTCCVYGAPQAITPSVEQESIVFVVEMNNDRNEIMGVGLIRNKPLLNKYYNVYNDGNFNRFIYKSTYRIDREQMIRHNQTLVETLDRILFKGKTHSKRNAGFSLVPMKLMKQYKEINFARELRSIFISVYS
jgi:hypothetical protein